MIHNRVIIKGFIDRIDIKDGEYRTVDYKTSKKTKPITKFRLELCIYKNLLEYVYEYAKKPANDADEHIETGIGNVMRRVVEAFSSFCYNMPFEEMMCRDVILKAIPEKKRKYYEVRLWIWKL